MRDVQRASEMRTLCLELVRCAINHFDADLPRSVVNLMLQKMVPTEKQGEALRGRAVGDELAVSPCRAGPRQTAYLAGLARYARKIGSSVVPCGPPAASV